MNMKMSEGPPYNLSTDEAVSVTVQDVKKPKKINKGFMDYFVGDEFSKKLSEIEPETNKDKNEDVLKNNKTTLSDILPTSKEYGKSVYDNVVFKNNVSNSKPKQVNYKEEDGLLKRMNEAEVGQYEGVVSGYEDENENENEKFEEGVITEGKEPIKDEKLHINVNKEWESEKEKIVFADTGDHGVTTPKTEVMPEKVLNTENKEPDKKNEEWKEILKEYTAYKTRLVTARKVYEEAIEEYVKEKQNSGFLSHFLNSSVLSEKQKVIDSAQSEYDNLLEGLRTQRQRRMDFFVKEMLSKKGDTSNESESKNRYISLHEAILEKQIDNEAKILESLKFQGGGKGVISTALRYTKTAFGHYSKLPRSARLGISMSIGLVLSGGANALGMATRKTAGIFLAPTVALEAKRFLDNKVEQYGEKKIQKQHETFSGKTLKESRDERVKINRKVRYGKTAATATVAAGTYAVLGHTDDAIAGVGNTVEGTPVGNAINNAVEATKHTVENIEVPKLSDFHLTKESVMDIDAMKSETSSDTTNIHEMPKKTEGDIHNFIPEQDKGLEGKVIQSDSNIRTDHLEKTPTQESVYENEHKTYAQKVLEKQRLRDVLPQTEEVQSDTLVTEVPQNGNAESIAHEQEKTEIPKNNENNTSRKVEEVSDLSNPTEKESVVKEAVTYKPEPAEIEREDMYSSMDIHELLNKIEDTPSHAVTPEEIDSANANVYEHSNEYKFEGIIEKGSSVEREFQDFIKNDQILKEKYPDLSDKDIGAVAHRIRLALEDNPEIAKALHVQNGNWDKVLADTKYSFYLDQEFIDHEIEQYKSAISEGTEDVKDLQKHAIPPRDLPTESKSLAQETLEALRAEKVEISDGDIQDGDIDSQIVSETTGESDEELLKGEDLESTHTNTEDVEVQSDADAEVISETTSDIDSELQEGEESESNNTDTENVEVSSDADAEVVLGTTGESDKELLKGEEQNIQEISTDKEKVTVEQETVEKITPDEHKVVPEQKETVPEPVPVYELPDEKESVTTHSETVSDSLEDDLRHAENKLEEQGADYHGLATRDYLEQLYKNGVFDSSLLQGQKHFILSNWGPISHATLEDIFDRDKSLTYTIGNNDPIKMGYQVEELSRSIVSQIQNNLSSKGFEVEELVQQGIKEKMTLGDFVKQTNTILDNSEKVPLNESVPEEIKVHEVTKFQELKDYTEPKIPEQGKIEGGRVVYTVPLHPVEISKDVESIVNKNYLVNHSDWAEGTAKELYESSEDFKKLINREKISLVSDIRAYEEGTQPLRDIRLDWSTFENMTPKELLMQLEQHQQKIEELIAEKNIVIK